LLAASGCKPRRRARFRERHVSRAPDEDLAELATDGSSPAEQLAAASRRELLRDLLCELPEPQAEVLALHTMLGYTVEETARVLGVRRNTVRSRLRTALSKLRERVRADRVLLEAIGGQP
jgi:RNA polymerase sigma-70 factor (ECF subfamily)